MLFSIKKARSSKILLSILLLSSFLFVVGCARAPSRGWSGPVVSDNVLYVGTIKGKVIALDISGGEPGVNWEKEIGKTKAGGFGCSSGISTPMSTYGTPAIGDGVVYVGGYDGYVYSFTTESGAENKFKTGGAIVGSPVVDGDTVFIGSSDGKLYALSTNNIKKEKWEKPFKTGGKIWSTPVIDNGVVYIGSADHRLYAIDAESGQEIWHFEAGAAILSTPLILNNMVYIGACDNKFYAIKVEQTGREATAEWVFKEAGNWFWTQALAYNGEIWVGNLDHKVYAIKANDPEDFQEVLETEGMVRTPPVLVNGRIIVGSEDGNIYTIDPVNKNWASLRDLEAPILAPIYPDTEDGVIYVHAQNGDHILYAINVLTGAEIWHYTTD
jgi:outer membrane protein assembly factor BamB